MFSQIFGLKPGVVSVIGSGGKTTLLSTLARELPGPVILCTTTHIFPFSEYPLISGEDAGALNAALARSRVVCLGQPGKDGKLTAPALSFSLLLELASWVLVEADGSKRLPLKAHAPQRAATPFWWRAPQASVPLSQRQSTARSAFVPSPEHSSRTWSPQSWPPLPSPGKVWHARSF